MKDRSMVTNRSEGLFQEVLKYLEVHCRRLYSAGAAVGQDSLYLALMVVGSLQ